MQYGRTCRIYIYIYKDKNQPLKRLGWLTPTCQLYLVNVTIVVKEATQIANLHRFWHACEYPWLHYSPSLDAVICGVCSVMLKSHERSNKGALVDAHFRNWVKISDTLSSHAKLKYHLNCSTDADTLHRTIVAP